METRRRPELAEPVRTFHARLTEGADRIPLAELAALLGARDDVLKLLDARGDLVLKEGVFINDGREMTVPAGRVEIEVPSILRGTYETDADGFRLAFPKEEYTVRACASLLVLRKCFSLRELRADRAEMVLDFGGTMADRRFLLQTA